MYKQIAVIVFGDGIEWPAINTYIDKGYDVQVNISEGFACVYVLSIT